MVTWEHRQAEALCRGQAITAITQTILNARQMTMSALPAIYERRMAT
jgi:hypothetical protein